jgi:hypothetical protein
LEGPSEAPELSQISNMRLGLSGDLGRQNRLAVHHANTLKDIKRKLALREEKLVHLMLYGDHQNVMEGSEALHVEFPLEGRHDVLQK